MSVFGVDFGNLNATVAITRHGGVDIVTNEVSRRETTTIVSFTDGERFIGEQALDRYVRNAQNTCFMMKRFIGMYMDDPQLEREKQFINCQVKGDEKGRLMFGVNYCDELTYFYPEQVLAMMLQRLRHYVNVTVTTDPKFPADVRDCVVTVPSYYTAQQRALTYQACEIAGLHCMSLINETTATGVDYGIFRGSSLKETEEEAQLVGIVDIGYGATDFSITKFWRGNCKVLHRNFDKDAGTRDIDFELFKHMSQEVKNKYKVDVAENKRASLRLLQACERLKYLLSANSTAPFNVENLMDVDVSIPNFERATMETLSEVVVQRVRAVLERGLAESGLKPEQFHSIEMIGGGCRIPILKRLVEDVMGRPPGFTLNASETTARGAAIMAAMLSPKFQVREFKMVELPTYPYLLGYHIDNPKSPSEVAFLPDVNKVVTLLGPNDTYPKLLDVTVPRTGPFKIYAFCDPESVNAKAGLQPRNYIIGEWEVGAPTGKLQGEVREVRIRMNLKPDGLVHVEGAWSVETYEVEEEQPGKPDPENPDAPVEKVKTVKKKSKQHETSVKPNLEILGNSAENVVKFRALEDDMRRRDDLIIRQREKKNELESYILDNRSRVMEGGLLFAYITDANRSLFIEKCEEDENWLYDEGEHASFDDYNARVEALRALVDPAHARQRNHDDVEYYMRTYRQNMEASKKIALDKIGKTEHLTEEELRKAAETADTAVAWADEEVAKMEAAPKFEDAAVSVSILKKKEAEVKSAIMAVANRPAPPKPKPEPKKEEAAPAPAANEEATPAEDENAVPAENEEAEEAEEVPAPVQGDDLD